MSGQHSAKRLVEPTALLAQIPHNDGRPACTFLILPIELVESLKLKLDVSLLINLAFPPGRVGA